MSESKNIVGERFGRWTVINNVQSIRRKNGRSDTAVLCKCDCGTERIIKKKELVHGSTKSCGCYRSDRMRSKQTTHGMTNTRIFKIWDGMNGRCKRNTHWNKNYAGRGITVCEEWRGKDGFRRFYDWSVENGYNDTLTIDRIDVNSGYSPENCRWVDMVVQGNNRRTNIRFEYNDVSKTISEWSRTVGINKNTLYSRIVERGWDIRRALEELPR